MTLDTQRLQSFVDTLWQESITPTLTDYIRIPNVSVDFDAHWQQHGHMEQARVLALDWLSAHALPGWKIHQETLPGLTPMILIEIPGASERTILMYGHLDKQPEMHGWWPGFGPWQPVLQEDKLYGRGGADDGYALFASVAALHALRDQNIPHARVVILCEFSEESGSPHLPAYLEKYREIIGTPELVVTLDSGTGDYQRLWSTTSLRGMLSCVCKVEVLAESTHSGIASGIIPSSMRIMRLLLDRLEDAASGEIRLRELYGEIPPERRRQAQATAQLLGTRIFTDFNHVPGLLPVSDDPTQQLLNNTWLPTLSVTGQDGMPPLAAAGNVLRAHTSFKLSFRLPPNVACAHARHAIEQALTDNPPNNARITVQFDQGGTGWDAPPLSAWLEQATAEASQAFYNAAPAYFGLGASIPFMYMLGQQYPEAQFLITGVLGPKSNAHGPNEFLHLPYVGKLTACVAYIIARHHTRQVTRG